MGVGEGLNNNVAEDYERCGKLGRADDHLLCFDGMMRREGTTRLAGRFATFNHQLSQHVCC